MGMKYWLIISVIIIGVGIGIYFAYDYGHGNLFSKSELEDNCLKILNKYVSNHPNNLHCEVLSGSNGDVGGDNLYVYTDQSGNVLTIDPIAKKISFRDKNGNNLSLPIK